ncbi:NADH-quinone oxidoreductase subunit NuoK [Rickettsiales endosymbiont of Stachyamoeba lipophora]|uniref:NADH-quinone oxidoreductase subunit NuoK n=1 Tax=Rickettsiales endosymbiont of Stachyamoeba lipophora TaxID=2486578 RepID=UPI000F6546B7|nr:NADH-quinone oxidoreductase subunit NuoK [Rickettsiales endosymbiont of Stachyamoeba lipophora]AZL15998.1 NADH-quinone oxidoreductase subunit NuoK [Rickettsiales endosymbiont of Stachyamoeba lipophora]
MLSNIFTSQIDLVHYFFLSSIIFSIGICGIFLNRRNIIMILMSIELMLLSVNINFVAASMKLSQITGQIFAIFILTVAAAETAIGLAILVIYFRNKNSVAIDEANQMKG